MLKKPEKNFLRFFFALYSQKFIRLRAIFAFMKSNSVNFPQFHFAPLKRLIS
jgi:hypothetical protein